MFEQSGVIPYRIENKILQVLLITSLKKKKWIFPKGLIEHNLSPFESAKKEAFEEAGVTGANETYELGTYSFKKWGDICKVVVYSMSVEKVFAEYPEVGLRKRNWFSVSEAIEKIENEELKNMLLKLEKLVIKN